MRAFIILCLVAAACAQYEYGAGVAGGSSPSYGGGSSPSYGGGNHGSASHDAPAFAQGGEVDKEFYSFSANEEDFYEPAASNQYANGGKQNLRVIFIKGPEHNGLEDAALALARQAAARKTAIYVLNKQHDLDDFANKFNNANKNSNAKPEVHFVKYRTPEDAANAQRAIQGQYDNLGGPSQNFNGGVAPTLNFASQGNRGGFGAASGPSSSYLAPASGNVSPNYLPASIFRRFRLRH